MSDVFPLVCRWCGRVAASSSSCWLRFLKMEWSSVITTGPTKDPMSTTSTRYVGETLSRSYKAWMLQSLKDQFTQITKNTFYSLKWCLVIQIVFVFMLWGYEISVSTPIQWRRSEFYLSCSRHCKITFSLFLSRNNVYNLQTSVFSGTTFYQIK